MRSIAAITAKRIDKKTGQTSVETRFYITSLPAALGRCNVTRMSQGASAAAKPVEQAYQAIPLQKRDCKLGRVGI
jgi:hypothetical protein